MYKKYRNAIIAGNWKMNKLASEIKQYTDELCVAIPEEKPCKILLCVPFPLIVTALDAVKDKGIEIAAQDVSDKDFGAYTGDVAAQMLGDLGVKYAVIGHSERRSYYGETDEQINKKAKRLLENGVAPIICVGESLDQREKGLTMPFVTYQVRAAFAGIEKRDLRKCIIAYEPIWAIGTGVTATAEQAEEACRGIRSVIRCEYGVNCARRMSILYGGSMNAGNCEELLAQLNIDGGLVGGASLDPKEFAKIIAATAAE